MISPREQIKIPTWRARMAAYKTRHSTEQQELGMIDLQSWYQPHMNNNNKRPYSGWQNSRKRMCVSFTVFLLNCNSSLACTNCSTIFLKSNFKFDGQAILILKKIDCVQTQRHLLYWNSWFWILHKLKV